MKASSSPSEGGDVPNGVSKGDENADRRGCLSLLCGTFFFLVLLFLPFLQHHLHTIEVVGFIENG